MQSIATDSEPKENHVADDQHDSVLLGDVLQSGSLNYQEDDKDSPHQVSFNDRNSNMPLISTENIDALLKPIYVGVQS